MKAHVLVCAVLAACVGATSRAEAACARDRILWQRAERTVTPEELAELGRLRFVSEALNPGYGEADDSRGTGALEYAYGLRHDGRTRDWTFTLTPSRGESGAIALEIPDRAEFFATDPQQGAEAAPGIPLLYKEWRFRGSATGSGAFRSGQFSLILQGRGTTCTNAAQFHAWILQVNGDGVGYTLSGRFRTPQPRAGVGPLFFESPYEAIIVANDLIRDQDWITLARYYDTSEGAMDRDELESGRYFTADRGQVPGPLNLRRRHPFTAGFTFRSAVWAAPENRVIVEVGRDLGPVTGLVRQSLAMKASGAGYQFVIEAPEAHR